MFVELNKKEEINKEVTIKKDDSSKLVSSKDDASKSNAAKLKSKLEAVMKKDLKVVRGMFKNHEIVGGSIKFIFHRYKEVGTQKYEFRDGEIYSVPYMVAEHINTNCAYKVHEHYRNDENKVQMRIGSKVQRFSFVPLDFTEETGLSSVVTVERV